MPWLSTAASIPYGGILVFADYLHRGGMRMAATTRQRVPCRQLHDSISASARTARRTTPVEAAGDLRVMPNMLVFRPADAVETFECWVIALDRIRHASTALVLSRTSGSRGTPLTTRASI